MAKVLVGKILTYDVGRWHQEFEPTRRFVRGPVLARCVGWDEVDAFLKTQGTGLIYKTLEVAGQAPMHFFEFPLGWDGVCVDMENIYGEDEDVT